MGRRELAAGELQGPAAWQQEPAAKLGGPAAMAVALRRRQRPRYAKVQDLAVQIIRHPRCFTNILGQQVAGRASGSKFVSSAALLMQRELAQAGI